LAESLYCASLAGVRGKKGPLPVQTGNPSILGAYKKAAKELGYKYGDPNGPQKEGTLVFSPEMLDFCSTL